MLPEAHGLKLQAFLEFVLSAGQPLHGLLSHQFERNSPERIDKKYSNDRARAAEPNRNVHVYPLLAVDLVTPRKKPQDNTQAVAAQIRRSSVWMGWGESGRCCLCGPRSIGDDPD
jgi:hypothetical protein